MCSTGGGVGAGGGEAGGGGGGGGGGDFKGKTKPVLKYMQVCKSVSITYSMNFNIGIW